jgi:putative transposase
MMFPPVTECVWEGTAVTVSCRVLGFSRQTHCRWLADSVCQPDWDDAHLRNRLIFAHSDDPAFGYRLLSDEVNAAGRVTSENRVHHLCRVQRLVSATVRRSRSKGRPGPAVHDDLFRRDFRATEAALCTAIAGFQPTGTVLVHSDRGWQFRSRRYQRTLRTDGLIGSMGRVASAGDDAAMESFVALLQNNALYRHSWETHEGLTVAIISCIEMTSHQRHRQRGFSRMIPKELKPAMTRHTAIAA